jgi:hypothetical protein
MIKCKRPRGELALDDECINSGLTDYPPPSYEELKQKIEQRWEVLHGVS